MPEVIHIINISVHCEICDRDVVQCEMERKVLKNKYLENVSAETERRICPNFELRMTLALLYDHTC